MTKEEMNKIKEDIIKRIDRGESTDDVLKNSGAMQLNFGKYLLFSLTFLK